MPNFEVFTKRMYPLVKQAAITIQRRGSLSLNKAAYAAMGSPEAVELLYDPKERIIGMRPVPKETEHAYPVRAQGQKQDQKREDGTFIVAGTLFTRYYDIDTSVSKRWSAVLDDGILCIDLKQPGTVVTSNRGRSAPGEEKEADAQQALNL